MDDRQVGDQSKGLFHAILNNPWEGFFPPSLNFEIRQEVLNL